jgi:hypothetical protein
MEDHEQGIVIGTSSTGKNGGIVAEDTSTLRFSISMSSEPGGKRANATFWLLVKGVALIATGFLASMGMGFVCVIRNALQPYPDDFKFAHEVPAAVYAAFFAVMVIWVFFAARFAWRNRTWLGLSLSAAAFIVFALKADNVLKFAYPVCNPF